MNYKPTAISFPKQRVGKEEKGKVEWYGNCCDYVIETAKNIKNANPSESVDTLFNILHGEIPDEFYRKTLNPYNAVDKKYQRFPADLRNYDLMRGVIRRYISEYIKNPHDFIVSANNPDIVLKRDADLRNEVYKLAEQEIAKTIQQKYQEFVETGQDPSTFNPKEAIDIEAFIEDFNANYVDDITIQAQNLLEVVNDVIEANTLYIKAFFEFVSFGQCFTYSDVIGNKLISRHVSVRDAFPIPNDNVFVEDYDAFACRRVMTYQQIYDEFGDMLTPEDREFFEQEYSRTGNNVTTLTYDKLMSYGRDICSKFTKSEIDSFGIDPIMARDLNSNTFEVWHVVWRGEVKRGIVTYQEAGIISQRIEEDGYVLDKANGDISIEWIWEPQVYECIRIGDRKRSIYPYKARAIAYNRNGKLPYNGLMELMPGYGTFSIVKTIIPYQIFLNIVGYHREMTIAKNKLNILLMAKSLLGQNPEDTIYRMAAANVLFIDDEIDSSGVLAQQVRILNADVSQYINILTGLMKEVEQSAMMAVDMTPQRYGDIAQSAGKGTTQEAVIRGSMGSVIIEYMFDLMRERDIARNLDFSKLAWIDGLNTSIRTKEGTFKYISLDVNSHVYSDYIVKAKLSAEEKDKLERWKEFAFSAAQNGDIMMAVAAIDGNNSAQIKKAIEKFNKLKEEHEANMKQLDADNAKMLQEFELAKIEAKGNKTIEAIQIEKQLDAEIETIRANANFISYNGDNADSEKEAARERIEKAKLDLQRMAAANTDSIERQKLALKEKEIESKERIAKNKGGSSNK